MEYTKKYVRFFSPGSFCEDDWVIEVDPSTRPQDVIWPERAHAFTMYTINTIVRDGTEYHSGQIPVSPDNPRYYHPDSKIVTLEELEKRADPADKTLIWNMRTNKWPDVIYTRWGNWPQPYEPNKVVVL